MALQIVNLSGIVIVAQPILSLQTTNTTLVKPSISKSVKFEFRPKKNAVFPVTRPTLLKPADTLNFLDPPKKIIKIFFLGG